MKADLLPRIYTCSFLSPACLLFSTSKENRLLPLTLHIYEWVAWILTLQHFEIHQKNMWGLLTLKLSEAADDVQHSWSLLPLFFFFFVYFNHFPSYFSITGHKARARNQSMRQSIIHTSMRDFVWLKWTQESRVRLYSLIRRKLREKWEHQKTIHTLVTLESCSARVSSKRVFRKSSTLFTLPSMK